jgi:hypothetical protein
MRVVHGGLMPFVERNNPRGGTFHYKRLVEGASGTPGNFGLMLSRTYDNFVSPRHRHNFEQIRFQIDGVCAFGRDGDMVPGTMGYFPEGAFYGPQSAEGEALVLVLQFGGPSGSGYMSEDDLQRSVAALNQVGEFRGGVFYRSTGEGRARQDAYEAAWEHHNGRTMAYPEPLYPAPILTREADIGWEQVAPVVARGATRKPLGAFEGGTAAALLKLEAGGLYRCPGACVGFVLSGEGQLGDESLETHASLHIEAGENADITSAAGLTMLVLTLPTISTASLQAELAA